MQRIFLGIFLLASVMFLSACSHRPVSSLQDSLTMDRPDLLYNEGLANLRVRNFYEATKKFSAIEARYPSSPYVRKALVMATFTNYLQQHYDDASNTGKRYLDLYPDSEDAAYVAYMIGLSAYHQMGDVLTDQAMAQETVTAMQNVIQHYPNSRYAADAKIKIRIAREHLAAKEMQIGRYYQNGQHYLAAIKRYRTVVEQYYDTNQIEEVLYRLVEVNSALGLASEARTAAWILGANYPNSPWYGYAYALLKKLGEMPQPNQSSWIIKALPGSCKKAS